jgi:hypothetical protein
MNQWKWTVDADISGVRMKTWLKNYADDLLYWIGALLIISGAFFVHPVAALFVAGSFSLHFSYLIGKAKANP